MSSSQVWAQVLFPWLQLFTSHPPTTFAEAAEFNRDATRSKATANDIRVGRHFWLEGKAERAQIVQTFCTALIRRYSEKDHDKDNPLPKAPM